MKIAIPVAEYLGLESAVYGHFGSAPAFAPVDSESMTVEPLANNDHEHVHGACSPLKALAGARPDVVIVGGMGMGALLGLQAAGITVYRSKTGTVAEIVAQYMRGGLAEMDPSGACAGHADGHVCH